MATFFADNLAYTRYRAAHKPNRPDSDPPKGLRMSNGRDSINKPILVAVFGTIGGLVAWILANAAGAAIQLGIRNTPMSILASMLIGAVAAWFAVYYLLPTGALFLVL